MDKQDLSPMTMLEIATQHVRCAEFLLQHNGEVIFEDGQNDDALIPVTSLLHMAFEITLKIFAISNYRSIKQHRNLLELVELNEELGLSKQEVELIKKLMRQQAFRKGSYYDLWENRQHQQIFCEQILKLYERIESQLPLEFSKDYQQ